MSDEAEVKRLTEAVEKLAREAVNLRRDVRTLGRRFSGTDWAPDQGARPPLRTVREALAVVEEARRDIRGAERDLASARSVVDLVAGDVMSREEMKGWLIERPSGPRRGG